MLTARLDRMGGAKEVAQIASVIGNEFSPRLLRDVAPIAEVRLDAELKKLVEAELLFEQGSSASISYRIQTRSDSRRRVPITGSSRRQDHHRKIAETLRERYPDVAETQPEILAHHYVAPIFEMPQFPISRLRPKNRCGGRRTPKRSPISRRRKNC